MKPINILRMRKQTAPGGSGGGPVTQLLMGFEGADGSTAFADESSFAHVVSGGGTAHIENSAFKFGATSLQLDGSLNSYLAAAGTAAVDLSGDFTIEAWIKPNVGSGRVSIVDRSGASGGTTGSIRFYKTGSTALGCRIYSGSSQYDLPTQAYTDDGNWHHVCVERVAGMMGVAVDGVFGALADHSAHPLNAGSTDFHIGRWQITTSDYFIGFMDEIRITNGASRYNLTNFAPPTAAFPRPGGGSTSVQLHNASAYSSGTGARTAAFKIGADGKAYAGDNGTYSLLETWLLSGTASSVAVYATASYGSITGTLGAETPVTADMVWSVTDTAPDATPVDAELVVELRDAATHAVLATATITLSADRV